MPTDYPAVQQIFSQAIEEARSSKSNSVRPEHVLLGLLVVKDEEAVDYLRKRGMIVSNVRELFFRSQSDYESKTPSLFNRVGDWLNSIYLSIFRVPPLSLSTLQVLKIASKKQKVLGHKVLSSDHIAFALLGEKKIIVPVLQGAGVDTSDLQRFVAEYLDQKPKT